MDKLTIEEIAILRQLLNSATVTGIESMQKIIVLDTKLMSKQVELKKENGGSANEDNIN